jgi:hypothetical protein
MLILLNNLKGKTVIQPLEFNQFWNKNQQFSSSGITNSDIVILKKKQYHFYLLIDYLLANYTIFNFLSTDFCKSLNTQLYTKIYYNTVKINNNLLLFKLLAENKAKTALLTLKTANIKLGSFKNILMFQTPLRFRKDNSFHLQKQIYSKNLVNILINSSLKNLKEFNFSILKKFLLNLLSSMLFKQKFYNFCLVNSLQLNFIYYTLIKHLYILKNQSFTFNTENKKNRFFLYLLQKYTIHFNNVRYLDKNKYIVTNFRKNLISSLKFVKYFLILLNDIFISLNL